MKCIFCQVNISPKAMKCPNCQEWLRGSWLKRPLVFYPFLFLFLNFFIGLPGWIYGFIQSNKAQVALDFKSVIEDAVNKASDGDVDSAIPEYQKALQIEPKNSDALQLLGYAEYVNWSKAKTDRALLFQALSDLKKAVTVSPQNTWAHYNYSIVLWAAGNSDEAVQQLRKLLDLDKSFKYKIQKDGQFKPFTDSPEFMKLIWG
jgi:tetratricopeptide (TPR) repeat protein